MTIVDFHTHFFSSVFFRTLAAQSPLPGSPEEKLRQASAAAGFELPQDAVAAHTARWIAAMDRHGVEHLCTFASVPEEIGAVCEAAALSQGRISAFALVNPRAEGAVARLDGLLAERRVRGALVFPAMHHWRWNSDEGRALLSVLERHAAIVYAHCGLLVVPLRDRLGLPRVQDIAFANPLDLCAAAGAHPRVRFVVPHFGAGFFHETLLLGAQCPNVFVDTSSSNSWRSTLCPVPTLAEVFARALDVFGAQRILFGTDSGTFPAGWRADRCDEQRAALLEAGADARVVEQVLSGNGRRLLA